MQTGVLRVLRATAASLWRDEQPRQAGQTGQGQRLERETVLRDLGYLRRAAALSHAHVICGEGGTFLNLGWTTISTFAPIERFPLATLAVARGTPTMARSRMPKCDASEAITNEIIRLIERGVLPWRKPWTAGGNSRPLRVGGEPYQGVNNFLLTMRTVMAGHSSPSRSCRTAAIRRFGNTKKMKQHQCPESAQRGRVLVLQLIPTPAHHARDVQRQRCRRCLGLADGVRPDTGRGHPSVAAWGRRGTVLEPSAGFGALAAFAARAGATLLFNEIDPFRQSLLRAAYGDGP